MSRIEILFLSEDLIERWRIVGQEIGGRDISDHFPIWLKDSVLNWVLSRLEP